MITNTEFTTTPAKLSEALMMCQSMTGKSVLNKPTNDFFYDTWEILPEYEGTVFDELLAPLENIGEARIIKQESGTCYFAHTDVDDRYHLNISGDCASLIDLDANKMYPLESDGKYYSMYAGKSHSAANFGQYPRYQLVVRKLLTRAKWVYKDISIHPGGENPRFMFDKFISPILNEMNFRNVMNNFQVLETGVKLTTNQHWAKSIKDVLPVGFKIVEH